MAKKRTVSVFEKSILIIAPVAVVFLSLFIGRYPVSVTDVVNAVFRPGIAGGMVLTIIR